jgi:zinc transport system substrate-binding protein
MRGERGISITLAAVTILGFGCLDPGSRRAGEEDFADRGPIVVYVTNYPLMYFAERIGGEHVEVHLPIPPGEDPAYWMPDAETISKYQQADLILLNGAGYEKWTEAVSLPKSKLCHTSAEFRSDYIALEDVGTHSHGPEGEHAHGGTAFTTWLDPTLAVKQADAVRASLSKLRPDRTDALRENFYALKSDLETLDREIADVVANAPDQPVLFSHPVYQYFERRYGVNARSVHWEPEEAPGDAMWNELRELLDEHPARWMIWEGEPAASTAEKLAKLGLKSLVFEPCGNVPAEGDYLDRQRTNLQNLAGAFSVAD